MARQRPDVLIRVDKDRGPPGSPPGMSMHSRSWHWDFTGSLDEPGKFEKSHRPKTAKQRGIRMRRLPAGGGFNASSGSYSRPASAQGEMHWQERRQYTRPGSSQSMQSMRPSSSQSHKLARSTSSPASRAGRSAAVRPSSSHSYVRPTSSLLSKQKVNRRPSTAGSASSVGARPTTPGSVAGAPPDVWLSDGRYRGQSSSQWRWHGKHGRPGMGGPKVPGAPWVPSDPGSRGGPGCDGLAASMDHNLKSRQKNKMQQLKYKMAAAAYGGDPEENAWIKIFEKYDTDGSGELDFDEFRKAIRRHGRMSIRSVDDDALREVFAIVDADNGGTVCAEEFEEFLNDPEKGTSLGPALTKEYKKANMTCGLYDTRQGKGEGMPIGTAPWARPESAPGYKKTQRTQEDWNKDETYVEFMQTMPPRGPIPEEQLVHASLPRRFLDDGPKQGRHSSAKDMDALWARHRRKQAHMSDKVHNVAFGGMKFRADGKNVAVHDVAHKAALDLFAAYDDDGGGTLSKEELARMGRLGLGIIASDIDGDGEIDMAELAKYMDEQKVHAMG